MAFSRRPFLRLPLLASALFMLIATSLAAQSPTTGMGRLAEFLPGTGQEDAWRFANANNSFEIENIGDPSAIRYYFVQPEPGSEGQRTIETAISIHPNSTGSAGLLYGLDQNRGLYHMLTLDAQGVVRLFRRDDGGFRPLLEQSSSAFQPGKMNTLRIQENRDEIVFSLNGIEMGSVGGNLYGFGAVGLGVVGSVRAFYNYFSDSAGSDQSALEPEAQQPRPNVATGPSTNLTLRRVNIMDEAGPAGQPIAAYQTMIPADWKTQGGVIWNHSAGQGRCFTGARLVWVATSPDQTYSVAFLEPTSWGVMSVGVPRNVCMVKDLTSAQAATHEYIEALSSSMRSQNASLEVISYEQPEEFRPLLEAFAKNWTTTDPRAQTWTDGIVVKTKLVQNGQAGDGVLLAITNHMAMQTSQGSFRSGQSALLLGLSAPEGQLDAGHPGFAAILNNLRVNPAWVQVNTRWWQQRRGELSAQIATQIANSNSIMDAMYDSWKRRQAAQDQAHQATINGLWEVEPWQTEDGSSVLLDQNYEHAWELGNGTLVMTNDANFSPMQAFNQTGVQLERTN